MTEFLLLRESSSSQKTRDLLRSGLDDAPAPEALRRTAAALGLTLAGVALSTPAAAAAVGGAAGAASKVSGTTALVLGKWLLSGLVGGALVSGAAGVVERERVHAAARVHVAALASASVDAPPTRGVPAGAPSSLAETRALEPEPKAAVAARQKALNVPNGVLPPPEASASRALGVEAARIDAARRALAGGDVRRALIELDWYERARVVGVLDREAALLRIEALVRAGEGPRAVELAQAYLAKHPHDAYAARLDELIRSHGSTFREGIDR